MEPTHERNFEGAAQDMEAGGWRQCGIVHEFWARARAKCTLWTPDLQASSGLAAGRRLEGFVAKRG